MEKKIEVIVAGGPPPEGAAQGAGLLGRILMNRLQPGDVARIELALYVARREGVDVR